MERITFQRIAKLAASELQSASTQKLFSSFFQGFQSFPQETPLKNSMCLKLLNLF